MAEELDAGTADLLNSADLMRTLEDLQGTADTDGEEPGATAEEEEPSTEALLDPATLPDELKPHWSRMSKAYQTRLNEMRTRERGLDDLEKKAAVVDRFYSDPAYARQIIEQTATRLGMSIGATGQQTHQQQQTGQVPNDVMQAVQEALADAPDLQFLVPYLAKAADAVVQRRVQPFEQRQEQDRETQRQAAWDTMQADFSSRVPEEEWGQHEDEMLSRLNFLRRAFEGGPLQHPRYGSLLDMLYRWTTGEAQATAAAGRRMSQALRSRTTTSNGARSVQPNIQEQIGKASDDQEKWAIAFQAALRDAQNA